MSSNGSRSAAAPPPASGSNGTPRSRALHAELERIGEHWTVSDDGLSRNGTHVNGERVVGRRRLHDGDVVRFGRTAAIFRQPLQVDLTETEVASEVVDRASLSEAQRRVLLALCRPFKESTGYVTPATNQQIADELFLSVDAVKTHLRALFPSSGSRTCPRTRSASGWSSSRSRAAS